MDEVTMNQVIAKIEERDNQFKLFEFAIQIMLIPIIHQL